MVENPLSKAEKVSDVEKFPFPDPLAPGRFTLAKEVFEQYGERYAICGDLECTIFEASWYLTGLEKFLLDLTLEKEYIFALLDRVMAYSIGVGKELARIGADFIWLGDDFGSQNGMLISPDMWRTHFKERMRTVISSIRAVKPEVKIAYHCCGSYSPIMADLIEVGVDILNALQPTAKDMDTAKIKAKYGKKATLFGGIDTQDAIPFGTMAQVESEILRVLRAAGKGGGLILAGAHNLQPDVSTEKLLHIFEFSKERGTYPIK
jgi:uroporphyrinogen decarboxylase